MTLAVRTVSDSSLAQKDLSKLQASIQSIEKTVENSTAKFAKFGAAIAGSMAIMGSIRALTKFSDEFTNLENRIKSVTESSKQFELALQGVKDVAMQTRSDLDATASLYQKIALHQKSIGINTKDTLRVVEVVGKALKLSGATALEASSAMLQFGQAMGSGRLQGDELRSIAENAPMLMKAIADSMKIAVGDLKDYGAKGLLTSAKIAEGLVKEGYKIDEVFEKMGVTWDQAFLNLRTGLKLLKDSVAKFVFGSGGTLQKWVNNIGLGAANIAKNLKYYMALSRAYVMEFIIRTVVAFEDLWPTIKSVFGSLVEMASAFYEAWKPAISDLAVTLSAWAVSAAAAIKTVSKELFTFVSGTSVFQALQQAFGAIKNYLTNTFGTFFERFKFKLPTIDVANFFKNLEPVKNMVLGFVQTIERAFFWLYDKVIGHSWVPDLVKGVFAWFSKLLGAPKAIILGFVGLVTGAFSRFGKVLFLGGLFKSVLGIVKLLWKVGVVFSSVTILVNVWRMAAQMFHEGAAQAAQDITQISTGFASLESIRFEPFSDEVFEKFDKAKGAAKDLQKELPKSFEKLKEKAKDNPISQTVKELKESTGAKSILKVPFKESYETLKKALGEAFGSISKKFLIPVGLLLSGIFSIALLKSIKSPFLRGAFTTLFSTSIMSVMAKAFGSYALAEGGISLANTIISAIERGLTKVLGGNALANSLGLLGFIAKLSILFAAGRAFLGDMVKKIATAPTMMARNSLTDFERNSTAKSLANVSKAMQDFPKTVSKLASDTKSAQKQSLTAFKNLEKALGGPSREASRAAARMMRTGVSNDPALAAMAKSAYETRETLHKLRGQLAGTAGQFQQLQNSRTALGERLGKLDEQIAERKAAARQGAINLASGLGGVVGGVAGLQVGSQLAEKLSPNTPEWMKLSVTMGSAFLGQFMGAALMGGMTSLILSAFAKGTDLLKAAAAPITTRISEGISRAVQYALSKAAPVLTSALDAGAKLFSQLPLWAKIGLAVGGALLVGYLAFKSLPDTWEDKIKGWFGGRSNTQNAAITSAGTDAREKALKGALTEGDIRKLADEIANNSNSQLQALRSAKEQADRIGLSEEDLRRLQEAILYTKETAEYMRSAAYENLSWIQKMQYRSQNVRGYATGGMIQGPGTSTSDSIPAMLSTGEFVVNAKSTSKYRGFLERINNGQIPHFASGGLVNLTYGAVDSGQLFTQPTKLEIKIPQKTDVTIVGVSESAKRSLGTAEGIKDAIGDLYNKTFDGLANIFPKDSEGASAVNGLRAFLKEMFTGGGSGSTPIIPSYTPIPKGPSEDDLAEKMAKATPAKAHAMLADVLKTAGGFDKIHPKDLEVLQGNDQLMGQLTSLTSRLAYFDKIGASGSRMNYRARGEAANLRETIQELLVKNALGSGEDPSTFKSNKTESDEDKKAKRLAELTLQDQFKIISEMMPDLGYDEAAMRKWSDPIREAIFGEAYRLKEKEESLLTTPLGVKKDPNTGKYDYSKATNPVKAAEHFKEIEALREQGLASAKDLLRGQRNSFGDFKAIVAELGLNIEELSATAATSLDVKELEAIQATVRYSRKRLEQSNLSESDIKAYGQQIKAGTEKAEKLIEEVTLRSKSSFERMALLAGQMNISFDRSLFYKLGEGARKILQESLDKLKELEKKIVESKEAPKLAAAYQVQADEIKKGLIKALEKAQEPTLKERAEAAGEAFVQDVREGFSSAFKDLLKGRQDEGKSVLETFLFNFVDSLTNTVIGVFVDGFSKKLFSEDGPLGGMLNILGGGLYGLGDSAGGSVLDGVFGKGGKRDGSETAPYWVQIANSLQQDLFPEIPSRGEKDDILKLFEKDSEAIQMAPEVDQAFSRFGENIAEIFDGFGDTFKDLLGGFGDMFKNLFGGGGGLLGSIFSLFGFAEGGYVRGPGTGTSDSIPAMLSNGEFVVRAAATRRFAPLLQAINSGNFERFAEGGLVGGNLGGVPSIASIERPVQHDNSQQVINLTITGDISRQTKMEIYKMLPQIAAGVNNQNRERNYKG